VDRKRMAVNASGKQAISHYRIKKRFRCHSLLGVKLESGRTHQIRVHMKYIDHPIVGDRDYGQRLIIPRYASEALAAGLREFKRQCLHATRLSLIHPGSGEPVSFEQPMPRDMQKLMSLLNMDLSENA